MSNNSIVEHRANYYYVEFREEFLIICMNCSYRKAVKGGKKSAASPHCKALILAILENWTNSKRGKKEDLAIFMTYKQWSDSMYGMFGRTAIIDSLDELIGEGLLAREAYKMLGNKDTYQYRLNYQELNRRLKLLPERDIHDTHPKMDASKNKPDASKNERVTHPKMDAYPSKNGYNIESSIESKNIDTAERKNAASRQRANVVTKQEATHSSIHASLPQSKNSSFSSSPKEKQEEVEFSPEEQAIYDFGRKDIFKAKPPVKTAKLKSECAELVPHIKTQEQFDSLLACVRSLPYIKGQIHIKNLVNGLNGWLQPQEAHSTPSSPRQKPSGPFIAQQPTESELEEIHRKNEEQIAKYRARVAAIKAKQQEGAKA